MNTVTVGTIEDIEASRGAVENGRYGETSSTFCGATSTKNEVPKIVGAVSGINDEPTGGKREVIGTTRTISETIAIANDVQKYQDEIVRSNDEVTYGKLEISDSTGCESSEAASTKNGALKFKIGDSGISGGAVGYELIGTTRTIYDSIGTEYDVRKYKGEVFKTNDETTNHKVEASSSTFRASSETTNDDNTSNSKFKCGNTEINYEDARSSTLRQSSEVISTEVGGTKIKTTTNKRDRSTIVDVSELASMMLCLGFALDSFEEYQVPSSEDEDDVTVEITCRKSCMKATLRKHQATCSCPSKEEAVNASMWRITGYEPASTGAINVSNTSILPTVSARKNRMVGSILRKVLDLINDPDIDEIGPNRKEAVEAPTKPTAGSTYDGSLPDLLRAIAKLTEEAYEEATSENEKGSSSGTTQVPSEACPSVFQGNPSEECSPLTNQDIGKRFSLKPRVKPQTDNLVPSWSTKSSQRKKKCDLKPTGAPKVFKQTSAGDSRTLTRSDTPRPVVPKKLPGTDLSTGFSVTKLKSGNFRSIVPMWK